MIQRHRHFPRDTIPLSETVEAWLLLVSFFATFVLIKTDLIALIVAHTTQFGIAGSFIEGFLYTSMLTTAPAIAAILGSASYVPAWELAIVGGLGAVCGDFLVFRFVQSRLVEHILRITLHPKLVRFGRVVARGPLWWAGPLFGLFVIASPLPDELGLLMMGLSRIRLSRFIPLSFLANAGGIYLLALAAQRLA